MFIVFALLEIEVFSDEVRLVNILVFTAMLGSLIL